MDFCIKTQLINFFIFMPGVTHYDSSTLAKFYENRLSMYVITVLNTDRYIYH